MRKAVIILLTFIYSLSAVGASLTIHYCGGEVASVAFFSAEKNKCTCPGGEMKKGCCESQTLTFKMKDDQSKSKDFTFSLAKSFEFQPSHFDAHQLVICHNSFVSFTSHIHNPPDPVRQPLYLLYQVFRI